MVQFQRRTHGLINRMLSLKLLVFVHLCWKLADVSLKVSRPFYNRRLAFAALRQMILQRHKKSRRPRSAMAHDRPIPRNRETRLTSFLHFLQLIFPHSSFLHRNSFSCSNSHSMRTLYSQNGHSSNPSSPAASTSLLCLTRSYRSQSLAESIRRSSESGKGSVHPDWSMQRMAGLCSPSLVDAKEVTHSVQNRWASGH